MKQYEQEASSKGLKGRIICGASRGYEATRTFSLEEVLTFIDEVNLSMESKKIKTIPCLVREGVIIGRASTSKYRDKAYDFEFSWSPRVKLIKAEEFYKSLIEYAIQLGDKMGQERVYLEFNGEIIVFRESNH